MQQVTSQRPLADQTYNIILEALCNGQYAMGEKLSQEQIAQTLNVSRQPVLQALGLLKAQGFLCNAGRRGLMVAPLEDDYVHDLYEFRGAIDSLTARDAARVCTADQAAAGRHILEQGETARKSASLIDLSVADMAFHRWVYQVAANRIVIETMNHYWNHIRRVMCAILSIDDEWPHRVWEEHQAIHEAIVARNSELAEHLAAVHVETASEALRRELITKLHGAEGEQTHGR